VVNAFARATSLFLQVYSRKGKTQHRVIREPRLLVPCISAENEEGNVPAMESNEDDEVFPLLRVLLWLGLPFMLTTCLILLS
jgi:hypothetical protein